MRLICPNCDAQYEVPDDVMPATGRDVQCSNCGQTWFQHHPDHAPAEDQDSATAPQDHDEEIAPPPPPPPPPAQAPQRKQLDPAVADILRQEAEAEQAARRAAQSGEGLESQPDLGLEENPPYREDESERRAREARERMARMRGEDLAPPLGQAAGAVAPATASGSRRDLLPDIDEINSTLRADTGGAATDAAPQIAAPTVQRNRRGFRAGFMTVVLIFVILAALYLLAPQIASAIPALEGPLTGYVAAVDGARLWLDGLLRGTLQSLDSVAGEEGG